MLHDIISFWEGQWDWLHVTSLIVSGVSLLLLVRCLLRRTWAYIRGDHLPIAPWVEKLLMKLYFAGDWKVDYFCHCSIYYREENGESANDILIKACLGKYGDVSFYRVEIGGVEVYGLLNRREWRLVKAKFWKLFFSLRNEAERKKLEKVTKHLEEFE